MARPASLENSLALHRLKCVDRPSSFGDMSVASLENMLRSSAAGKFAFFAYVPVLQLAFTCPFHLPWGCPDDSRLHWLRCRKSLLQYLSEAGPCGVQQKCHACRKKCWTSLVFFFLFHFFLFWWTCFNRSFCLACEGFPEETILWDQVSREGSWALRSQSLPVCSICTFPRCVMAITVVEKTNPNHGSTKKPLVWRESCVCVPHVPRPAEWGAILFLCLPTLTRPGLDLGLSRTVQHCAKKSKKKKKKERKV